MAAQAHGPSEIVVSCFHVTAKRDGRQQCLLGINRKPPPEIAAEPGMPPLRPHKRAEVVCKLLGQPSPPSSPCEAPGPSSSTQTRHSHRMPAILLVQACDACASHAVAAAPRAPPEAATASAEVRSRNRRYNLLCSFCDPPSSGTGHLAC
eukprot:1151959-Pelagomonas_calceolata.AAC.3